MQRKQETIYCLSYFTIIFTSFRFMHQLALLYITFLIKKIKRPVVGAPDGGGPPAMAQMAQWVIRPCLAGRHHIHENLLEEAFIITMGPSTGPDILLFKRY